MKHFRSNLVCEQTQRNNVNNLWFFFSRGGKPPLGPPRPIEMAPWGNFSILSYPNLLVGVQIGTTHCSPFLCTYSEGKSRENMYKGMAKNVQFLSGILPIWSSYFMFHPEHFDFNLLTPRTRKWFIYPCTHFHIDEIQCTDGQYTNTLSITNIKQHKYHPNTLQNEHKENP